MFYKVVTKEDFIAGTSRRHFSEDGAGVLYDYLNNAGSLTEFSPEKLARAFKEYKSFKEFKDKSPVGNHFQSLKEVKALTTVIKVPTTGGFIIEYL